MFRFFSLPLLMSLTTAGAAIAQTPPAAPQAPAQRPARPAPPTRDPATPGYVTAKDLPDGANAPVNADGNFILGPTHNPAPEMTVPENAPRGTISTFTLESADSKFYPGIAREPNGGMRTDPADPT